MKVIDKILYYINGIREIIKLSESFQDVAEFIASDPSFDNFGTS